ncbi:MAG: GntP family permease [Clostridiales bacterium]|nr:GntP family permease [Clostridiales bacterium]
MDILIVLGALVFLMVMAYRGYSVILFSPIAAMGAVLLVDPAAVAPAFNEIFMEKMAGFLKLYFPVFLLGAIFGKLIELSGFSKSIVTAIIKLIGPEKAIPAIVLVCAILTYGGVSLFVVVFAVYPFAAEMFRQSNIPKRLIPGAIALGAISFTMDALPGTPQIQNIIPTPFFNTTTWAAPCLGIVGSITIFFAGMAYLEWARRKAASKKEGYGLNLLNEPESFSSNVLPSPWLALTPLVLVGITNFLLTYIIPLLYCRFYSINLPGLLSPLQVEIDKLTAVWAVEGAMLMGIVFVLIIGLKDISGRLASTSKTAAEGAILAAVNTASQYGFGAVIASLPGFLVVADALKGITDPLLNAAVTVTSLSGITGSASGGMSIALAAMSDSFILAAQNNGIPMEVLHRVVAMASGGMDSLPHNGVIITLLAVTGLTHRQAYKDILAITVIKTLAAAAVIIIYNLTGLV